jgi:DNA-binding MarR family transcriptional regulator
MYRPRVSGVVVMPLSRTHAQKIEVEEPSDTGTSAPAILDLDDNLAYRLSLLSFLVNKATSRIYNSAGLGTNHWKVLSVLNSYEPMTAQSIARWVTLDKVAISRTVRQLLELKLVDRKLHSMNGRLIEIKMTARGRRMYNAIAQQTATHQATLLQDVTVSDRRALFQTLRQIEETLNRMPRTDD